MSVGTPAIPTWVLAPFFWVLPQKCRGSSSIRPRSFLCTNLWLIVNPSLYHSTLWQRRKITCKIKTIINTNLASAHAYCLLDRFTLLSPKMEAIFLSEILVKFLPDWTKSHCGVRTSNYWQMLTDVMNTDETKKKSHREKKFEWYYSRRSCTILYSPILTNMLPHDMNPGYPDYKLDTRVWDHPVS